MLIEWYYFGWAAKAAAGKFLTSEILAIMHGYFLLEDDKDFCDCDTDSGIYDEDDEFGIDDEKCYESE